MSYEGFTQILCKNGHYFEKDAYFDWDGGEHKTWKCPVCGVGLAWQNGVDQTNCCGTAGCSGGWRDKEHQRECTMGYTVKEADAKCCHIGVGYVKLEVLEPEKTETCKCCGHTKKIEPARYKIPEK